MLSMVFLVPAVFALLIWNAYRTARVRAEVAPLAHEEGEETRVV